MTSEGSKADKAPTGPRELRLSDDEVAFLRYTCNMFFLPESPLYVFEAEKREPKLFGAAHDSLCKKGLVDPDTWRGKDEALQPVVTVAECDARVLWQRYERDQKKTRDFYVAGGMAVEFKIDGGHYVFSPAMKEREMVHAAVAQFKPSTKTVGLVDVVFSPGEYLVFAVFARDVRATAEDSVVEDHMSIEEVLACFEDEAEIPTIPRDSDFRRHAESLQERALLEKDKHGNHRLVKSLHAFARGLSSESYDALTRYDFIDEEWLIRETTIYPCEGAIYLLSSLADGSVSVQELDGEKLHEVLAQAIATLPDISDNPAKPRFAKDFFLRA
ncbi:MAG: hypothetical protein IT381_17885 [Deltaproteobacteria bacterium]|nr:hypothetical protein [Deltaproteobacteria bacterium]